MNFLFELSHLPKVYGKSMYAENEAFAGANYVRNHYLHGEAEFKNGYDLIDADINFFMELQRGKDFLCEVNYANGQKEACVCFVGFKNIVNEPMGYIVSIFDHETLDFIAKERRKCQLV